jgi:hypothetical protein
MRSPVPSLLHEKLVELFESRPALAGELLRARLDDVALSARDLRSARVDASSFEQTEPPQYSADKVVLFGSPRPMAGVVVEIQRNEQERKRYSWPIYLAQLRARHRCPVFLIVVAMTPALAAWCARPIALGHPGFVLEPIVVGPGAIATIVEPAAIRAAPERAVLAAVLAGRSPEAAAVAKATIDVLLHDGDERYTRYVDLIAASLDDAARAILESWMKETHEFVSPYFRRLQAEAIAKGEAEGRAKGEVKGRAEDVLLVLRARGIEVDDGAEARIRACGDAEILARWLVRAVTAVEIDDLFA